MNIKSPSLHHIICGSLTLPEGTTLSPDKNLVELGLDSLRLMRLINTIEKKFNITLNDDLLSLEYFETLTKIETMITNCQAN